eukprot:Gb_00212 [translate_table: standard]
MSSTSSASGLRKLIRIDVTSDTICPWCFIGKKRLEEAMNATKDLYKFEVKWHPFMLDPNLPKEGLDKNEYHKNKFGYRAQALINTVDQAFQSVGYRFGSGGLIGNTLDSHRLIELAGRQGLDKQNAVVENLMIKCLTQEKNAGDRTMSSTSSASGLRKLIRIDVTSDTICPWCFIGKKRLEEAMNATKDLYKFEVKWHPFMLDPNLPKEGLDKNEYHKNKFGYRAQALINTVDQAFQSVGYRFGSGGLIGNTLDSHRLIELAGRQGLDKQNAVVENLMIKCLTQEKNAGDSVHKIDLI